MRSPLATTLSRSAALALLARFAQPRYRVQSDAGRDARVQRLGRPGDGDPGEHITALGDQPRQALALGADDEHERGVGELQLPDVLAALSVQAGNEQAVLLIGGQRP